MDQIVDAYNTIENPAQGEYKEKGSKFIAYAFEIENEAEFRIELEKIKKEHFKARHHCFAYKVGIDDDNFRYNDDGEPGGTAGLPIFNQIKSYGLTNIAIIVVRYFGGTKLGVSGLIHAYKAATIDAIEKAIIIEKYVFSNIEIEYNFDMIGVIMKVLNSFNVEITDNLYDSKPKIVLKIRKSKADFLKKSILASILNRDLKDIVGEEKIDGLIIEIF